jgi:CMP-N-acetylneuraminic acid synthetase
MIPARIGSTRLKMKNLALINGKPLIYYAIQAAKESGVFDKIVLNSENQIFDSIANEYNVEFYRRPERLGSSETKSDEVIADFINKHKDIDIVAWVNPIAPFQTGDEINRVVKYFIDNNLDSLITVEEKNVHWFL